MAAPAYAATSTISVQGSQLTIVAQPGADNQIAVTQFTDGTFRALDTGADLSPGDSCVEDVDNPGVMECSAADQVSVDSGDGNENVLVSTSGNAYVHAGEGNDTVQVTSTDATRGVSVDGGPGDDSITTGDSGDGVNAGPGDDTVDTGAGDD